MSRWRHFCEKTGQRLFMGAQHEAPQPSRAADEFLETVQAGMFEPPQHGRPRAGVRLPRLGRVWQRRPVPRRPRVVLAMVAVVEEEPIVKPAVVTDRAARVLETALQLAEPQPQQPAWQING